MKETNKSSELNSDDGVDNMAAQRVAQVVDNLDERAVEDHEAVTTEKSTFSEKIFYVLCILVTGYHLYTVVYFPPTTLMHRSLHVGMMLVLCFFMYPMTKKGKAKKGTFRKVPWYDYILMLLAMSVPFYIITQFEGIVSRSLIPNTVDTLFATILILIVLEGMRRSAGLALPLICGVFLLYGLFGRHIPGVFRHRGYTWEILASHLFSNTEGIFGTSVAVAASFIFMFVLFGAIMAKTGMGQLFTDLALSMAGSSKGGPAKMSVISSALLGTVKGSAVANIVTTGPFTIPLMDKIGYKKDFSAGVEAAASIGSQILPPVMGAAAFIMAQMTGYAYGQIIVFALIPALLFYFGIMMQVHFRASKTGLVGMPKDQLPQTKTVLKERGHLLIPLLSLNYFLIFTPMTVNRAALYTIILTIVFAQLRKTTRMSLKDLFDACAEGARQTVSIAVACAAVGIIVGVISITGFGMSMVNTIVQIGGQSIPLMLIVVAVTSLILGLGVPSIPAYIITASIAAPALVQLGVPLIAAHMFVFYFSKFANITPPIGLVTMAAASINGADFMRTGINAVKLTSAGFIIPFVMIFSTDLMLINTTVIQAASATLFAAFGIYILAVAIEGYMLREVNPIFRIMAVIAAILMIIPELITSMGGLLAFFVILVFQLKKVKQEGLVKQGT
ncbi:MAG: TRAP transporter permease [Defluviitaleaceae bacterium]|nr:TRAP transporter permease [Defluviitaleaceae bacterium]